MDKEQIKKAFIDKHYNGDVQAYDDMIAETDQFKKEVEYGKKQTLRWDEVVASVNCHPEYEEYALRVIDSFLGYLPKPLTYMPHEGFLRSVIASYNSGQTIEEVYLDEVEFHCKRIRNDDMVKFAGVTADIYGDNDYRRHENHLALYKNLSKERLYSFLNEDLILNYSLDAEIFLRQLFQMDIYHRDLPFCEIDYRAATIFNYRKTFLLEGKKAAEDSPLTGLKYQYGRIALP